MAVAEPGESAFGSFVFWALLAAIFAAPFWLPVITSNQPGVIAGVLRLGSLIVLVLVTLIAGHLFYFDLDCSIQGQEVSIAELLIDALVAGISAISVFIVFKSDARAVANDT